MSNYSQARGIISSAESAVNRKLGSLDATASRYSSQLSGALSTIGSIRVADVPAPDRPAVPETPVPQIDLSGMPEIEVPALTIPEMPGTINIDGLLGGLDVDLDIPMAPEPMPFSVPEAPGMANITAPERPKIDTNVDIPEPPTLDIPEMEALEKLNIPEFTFPELPDFDGKPPTTDGIAVPDVFLDWQEPDYASESLEQIQSSVASMMEGGTGLPAAVEDALFSRARERDSAETERAVQEAMDVWASRDFSMPPGMLAKQISVLREQGRLKAAELNRDILIEAAKWQIESIRFAVQQGLSLEQLTMNLHENRAKRLFEMARFRVEARINVFNAQISLFNAQNGAFETLAQVYRTKLDGAIAKLTAYKTAIEGQAALGQINQQKVEVFKAKLTAVQSNVEVYKALMSGAQTRADVIKNQFDAYRADVQAYAEQIGAEKVKFDAYESQVKAESAKVGMYEAQSRAYASTVQAMASKADVKVKEGQLKMEAARTMVSKFLADVDAYKAGLQASLGEIQASTSAYAAQVDGWKAQTSASVAEAEMQSRFADMATRTNIAYAEMQISEYQAKIQKAVEEAKIALEASKAMGQYTAQLAAGAMSAMHVSASISGSGSASVTDSVSESQSISTNHNYNY